MTADKLKTSLSGVCVGGSDFSPCTGLSYGIHDFVFFADEGGEQSEVT